MDAQPISPYLMEHAFTRAVDAAADAQVTNATLTAQLQSLLLRISRAADNSRFRGGSVHTCCESESDRTDTSDLTHTLRVEGLELVNG